MSNVDTVRAVFDAYHQQDLDWAQELYAADFVFTSPQDDHIDRAAFFERCFPTTSRLLWQRLLHVVDVTDEDVFVLYEYELRNGERYRNTEVLTVRDGKLVEAQVFFGGRAH